jgi:hypothetical protein
VKPKLHTRKECGARFHGRVVPKILKDQCFHGHGQGTMILHQNVGNYLNTQPDVSEDSMVSVTIMGTSDVTNIVPGIFIFVTRLVTR